MRLGLVLLLLVQTAVWLECSRPVVLLVEVILFIMIFLWRFWPVLQVKRPRPPTRRVAGPISDT